MRLNDPRPGDRIEIDIAGSQRVFSFLEFANAPGMTHSMDGGRGTIHRVLETTPNSGKHYALKVPKVAYRDPAAAEVAALLGGYSSLPGLSVCARTCITRASSPAALRKHPELECAILMPWIEGRTWFDFHQVDGSARPALSNLQGLDLAYRLATSLRALEAAGSAHTDVSPGNVVTSRDCRSIELLDVEEMFIPTRSPPHVLGPGTPGYAHAAAINRPMRSYCAAGDRFAGAVLMAELLGWHSAVVREHASGDSYFLPKEMHSRAFRYAALRRAVEAQSAQLATLFDRAWFIDGTFCCGTIAASSANAWDDANPAAVLPKYRNNATVRTDRDRL